MDTPDATDIHAFPSIPLELVDDILQWAMEVDAQSNTAISLATVCRYTHHQAVKHLYCKVLIKNFNTLRLLNITLKASSSLAKLVRSLIIDLIDDGSYNGKWVREQLIGLFTNISTDLENLHVLCNSDRFFEYPYSRLDLRSLLCRNHSAPHVALSQPHLTHLIHDDPDHLVRFEPAHYPELAYIATTVILPWADIWTAYTLPAFVNLIEQQGSRLKYLVVVLAREIATLAERDLRAIVHDMPVELITLVVPSCLGPIKKWTARDFFNLKASLSQAHFDGSLWNIKTCNSEWTFRNVVPDGRPIEV